VLRYTSEVNLLWYSANKKGIDSLVVLLILTLGLSLLKIINYYYCQHKLKALMIMDLVKIVIWT